jgi:hypothetical protein
MLKLHGGSWTEYEIPSGNLPPVVTGSSDGGATAPTSKNGSQHSHLNGSRSPFFESTPGEDPAQSVLFAD